ncbi:hypothetical protein TNCV_4793461 [Trichonephila clavipes]|nr:hypothetical protein TNCV_4793461 [Trichonephila clavipes]
MDWHPVELGMDERCEQIVPFCFKSICLTSSIAVVGELRYISLSATYNQRRRAVLEETCHAAHKPTS